jgi:hypothetical protein
MDEQQYISKGRPPKNAEPKNAPKERGAGQGIQFVTLQSQRLLEILVYHFKMNKT